MIKQKSRLTIARTANRRLAQWRVTWLFEHSTSHQLLWCIESFVLRNPPLRQAPNRYSQLIENPTHTKLMSRPSFKTFPSDTFLKGVECALTNSFELYNDAILLLNNGRLSRAYSLFQFSIEESGKTILLLDLYTAVKIHENNPNLIDNKVVELHKALEDKFYNHRPKTEHILKYELANTNKFIEAFEVDQNAGIVKQRNGISEGLNSVKQLDNMKNQSLYTFIDADNFVLPSDKFDLGTINKIMASALSKIMLTKNKTVRFLKTRQIPIEINVDKLEALRLDHPN